MTADGQIDRHMDRQCDTIIPATNMWRGIKMHRQVCHANSDHPDQMLHTVVSDKGLYCLLLIKHYLDTSTGLEMD